MARVARPGYRRGARALRVRAARGRALRGRVARRLRDDASDHCPPQRFPCPWPCRVLGVRRSPRVGHRADAVPARAFLRPVAGARPTRGARPVPELDAAARRQSLGDAARAGARCPPRRRRTIALRRVRRLASGVAEERACHCSRAEPRLRVVVRACRLTSHTENPAMTLRIEPARVEEAARELYIRALKILPPDIKRGFDELVARETDATAQSVLGVMVRNIAVAEQTDNLLCQDTGLPIYNVTIRSEERRVGKECRCL